MTDLRGTWRNAGHGRVGQFPRILKSSINNTHGASPNDLVLQVPVYARAVP
ncbi:MAG TPA: hypothetical protein VMH05_04725 [Bryobacteraceae bacterium]|nr:hypothetical protein [Bryobacteraceae bacterium]